MGPAHWGSCGRVGVLVALGVRRMMSAARGRARLLSSSHPRRRAPAASRLARRLCLAACSRYGCYQKEADKKSDHLPNSRVSAALNTFSNQGRKLRKAVSWRPAKLIGCCSFIARKALGPQAANQEEGVW